MAELSPLSIIVQLCKILQLEGIVYCHWKSNSAIDRSASGDNDLDLLVSRCEIQRFREILTRLGFKECLANKVNQIPGVQDFFGYDPRADKFVHVHAHYQLIIGHDLSKNYHLPLEQSYLDSAQQCGLFKLPAPEYELVIFVIRMVIKHSTWTAVLTREGALSKTEKQELACLETQVDRLKVIRILQQYLPFIDIKLFDECLSTLRPGFPLMKRIAAGSRLLNKLTPFQRRSRLEDWLLKLWRRFILVFQWRVFKKSPKYRLADGGAVVAIVGGDGSGKTTVVNELAQWLSNEFEINTFHLGKPRWSLTTIVIRGIVKIGRSLGFYPFERAEIQYTNDKDLLKFPGYPWMIREVCTGRDRYLTYTKAQRYATNGGVVICDRYPLPEIKFMDGPQIERLTKNYPLNMFIKYMLDLEKHFYLPIMTPDLLIVLRTDPEIATQRKKDEDSISVRQRSTEIWEIDWSNTTAHVIDGGRDKAEVLSDVKALVWTRL